MSNFANGEKIEWNENFKRAYDLMENSSESLFVSGRAGTGKSTLVDHFRINTKKQCVVLAPTGVAALNVKGQTIHSFFGFKPGITPSNIKQSTDQKKNLLYKQLEIIIVDEISMARADLIDCMDVFLRMHARQPFEPFGGVQVVFIGDLYQLPPVVVKSEEDFFYEKYDSPFFFDAKVFKNFQLKHLELDFVYRQKEAEFIEMLDAIRCGNVDGDVIEKINKRVDGDLSKFLDQNYIYLSTTNFMTEKINQERLSLIGSEAKQIIGSVSGDFPKDRLPTQEKLILKKGAQVMLLINDSQAKWVNGDIGIIKSIKEDLFEPEVVLNVPNKGEKTIKPFKWEIIKYIFNKKKNIIEAKVSGHFHQLPLKLAWAVTIHKAQGKTFDRVVVDFASGTFASGQAYVALSRCRTLDGLILRKPINKHSAFVDERIVDFFNKIK